MGRAVRLTAVQRVASTAIVGAVGADFQIEAITAEGGQSDAAIGITSLDVIGWKVSGNILLDDDAAVLTLAAQGTELLKYLYKWAGGTAKTRTFDKVHYGEAVDIAMNPGEDSGKSARYRVPWEGVFDSADDTIDDFTRVA